MYTQDSILKCGYDQKGIGKVLSNLFPHEFKFGGITFASMEGFLQSLKTNDLAAITTLSSLHGVAAWREGQKYNNWKKSQTLYFLGKTYARESREYEYLIISAYNALFNTYKYLRVALRESLPRTLTHSVGKTDPRDSVLTQGEYIGNLERLRALTL